MATDRLLDYLAGILAEAYRRELDQEENVWRSLPFFAATLALQLAVVVPLRGWFTGAAGLVAWLSVILIGLGGTATLIALIFLALSILPANFEHVAQDPDLFERARLIWVKAATRPGATEASVAEATVGELKAEIVRELSEATKSNHLANRRRADRRANAGLAMLVSVCATLALVGLAMLSSR